MNFIWSGMIIVSFIFGIINERLSETLTAGINGASEALGVLLSFAGIMCFWSGILKISEQSGISDIFANRLSPVTARLFPHTHARENITLNIIANLLGMGNAATPAGIAAMRTLDEENGQNPVPSRAMCRFAVMNTASLQIIPTTACGILASCGAENPYKIVPLVWITSLISLTCALCAEKLTSGGKT